jgi:hypothetical protein
LKQWSTLKQNLIANAIFRHLNASARTLFVQLFVRVGSFLTKSSITPQHFIGMPVSSQQMELSYICVLGFRKFCKTLIVVFSEEETAYPSLAHEFAPSVFRGVSYAHCFIVCVVLLCVFTFFSYVLWCPLWFPQKNDVWFVFTALEDFNTFLK